MTDRDRWYIEGHGRGIVEIDRDGTVLRSEYEVTVENPESLVALGKELRAQPWTEPGFVPYGTGRPLNRAGRRAQRRGKR